MRFPHRERAKRVCSEGALGTSTAMALLLLFILAVLLIGVVGAIKLTAWVLLIALAIAVIAGFVGRSAFSR